jgi:hypothetical protein
VFGKAARELANSRKQTGGLYIFDENTEGEEKKLFLMYKRGC